MEHVMLGTCGIRVSRLAFGTGTNGWNHRSEQSDLGVSQLADLLCFAHERGVTFWDTADQYGTHAHVAAALKHVRRETVVLTTKTVARKAADVRADVERFCRELRTEYLDIVLLHCVTAEQWPREYRGAMDALSQAQEDGLVRAVGVSCHSLAALGAAAAEPWVEVLLARINHAGDAMDAAPAEVVPHIGAAADRGKGVYGMKALGAGTALTQDPERAIGYSLSVHGVAAVVVGMRDRAQIAANIDTVARTDLPE